MTEIAVKASSFEELTKMMDEADKADKLRLKKLLIKYGIEDDKAEELLKEYYDIA
jgi:hypothetical protein